MIRQRRIPLYPAHISVLQKTLALAMIGILLLPGPLQALPTGAQLVNGAATISTSGSTMTITNSSGTIINWNGFSIAQGETARFVQPTAASMVMNRVVGTDPSAIFGALQSNGKVFLINPNGVIFGATARIDVNGLVASTLNMTNEDFLAGRLKFSAGPLAGKLENQGTITTPSGGQVYLIAPDIKNSGVINAPNGDILLAAGKEVLLVDSDSPEIAVVVSAPEDQALNLGQLTAAAGRVGLYGGIVRQAGLISADSALQDASGRIFLRASKDVTLESGSRTTANGRDGGLVVVQAVEGTTLVSGSIQTTGSTGSGGTVQLLGQQVGLIDQAVVDASGVTGGGTVLVGGDYKGGNPLVQNALATYMGAAAGIKADATGSGNGGKVILWSDTATRAYGNISASGGQLSGNGGFVETSGGFLDVEGIRVDTQAPMGSSGRWLLDPNDIFITASGVGSLSGTPPTLSFAPGTTSSISWSTIEGGLASTGTVTIQTTLAGTGGNGDIIADDGYSFANAGAGTLVLDAYRDIVFNRIGSDLTGSSPPPQLQLLAGRSIVLNNSLLMSGSTLQMTASGGSISQLSGNLAFSSLTASAIGGINLPGANSVSGLQLSNSGSGNIFLNSAAANTAIFGIGQSSGGNIQVTSSGQLTVFGTVTAGSGVTRLSGDGITVDSVGTVAGSEVQLEATGSLGISLLGGSIGGAATQRVEFVADAITGTGTVVSVSGNSLLNEILFRPFTPGSGIITSAVDVTNWDAPTLVFGDGPESGQNIGTISAGPLNWTGGNRQRVAFLTNGSVNGGNIVAGGVGVIASGSINLSGNTVGYVALQSGGGGVSFSNTAALAVVSATGGITEPTTITGVSSNGGAINLAAGGDITIVSPINAGAGAVSLNAGGGIYTGSPGAVNVYGGSLSAYAGTNIGGPTYALMTQTPLWSSLNAEAGSLYLDNIGAVETTGSVYAGGMVGLSAHSPLTIGAGGVYAVGDIKLLAAPMGGLDDLTINGEVLSSTGNIYLAAGNLIIENALVTADMGTITRTPYLNGGLVPPSLQPTIPDPPIYGDPTTTTEGLVLVAELPSDEIDDEEDEDQADTAAIDDGQQKKGGSDGKPQKRPYCN